MQSGSFTTLSETRDTAHSKEVNKLVSGVQSSSRVIHKMNAAISSARAFLFDWLWPFFPFLQKVYKSKFEKEKGKSIYNQMTVPPDVQHAMDVAKTQSSVRPYSRHVGMASQHFEFLFSQCSCCVLSALLPDPAGLLPEGCQSQPPLHYCRRPSRHQEGYPGCQTYQWCNQMAKKKN